MHLTLILECKRFSVIDPILTLEQNGLCGIESVLTLELDRWFTVNSKTLTHVHIPASEHSGIPADLDIPCARSGECPAETDPGPLVSAHGPSIRLQTATRLTSAMSNSGRHQVSHHSS